MNTKELQAVLHSYTIIKSQLIFAKSEELRLRKELANYFLKGKHIGTHNFESGDFKIKAVKKVTTSLDSEALNAMFNDFSNEERECIKFDPKLIMKNYKSLDDEHRDYINMCIIVKPSLPALTVEERISE